MTTCVWPEGVAVIVVSFGSATDLDGITATPGRRCQSLKGEDTRDPHIDIDSRYHSPRNGLCFSGPRHRTTCNSQLVHPYSQDKDDVTGVSLIVFAPQSSST
jgi:hypothetical protein